MNHPRRIGRLVQRTRENPVWLTIFSDMTTNLMLFFLMLFAMTRMTMTERQMVAEGMENVFRGETVKSQVQRERTEKRIREERAVESLREIISRGELAGAAAMDVTESSVRVTLDLPVFFATGSAELGDRAAEVLSELVAPLGEFDNDIIIEGHTDNVPISGTYRSNWELSIARAVKVANFFIDRGLDPRRLVTAGYGEYHPAFPNDTWEHRARNRRIEITIVRKPRG